MCARIDRQCVELLLHGKRCRCGGCCSFSWHRGVHIVFLAKPALVGSGVKIVQKEVARSWRFLSSFSYSFSSSFSVLVVVDDDDDNDDNDDDESLSDPRSSRRRRRLVPSPSLQMGASWLTMVARPANTLRPTTSSNPSMRIDTILSWCLSKHLGPQFR